MKTYQCAHCGGTFESGWTDDEANAEAERLYGVKDASQRDDMAQICDDCFKAFETWRVGRDS